MIYRRKKKVKKIVLDIGESSKVIDIGGWAKPFPLATHVVDIMPYETRGGTHSEIPYPEERFTEDTWIQKDVTHPKFRLPFPENFFDYATCMHTLEDLHEVRPLVWEMSRVSKRGYIETPSRLKEQTIGISDRACSEVGFNHHEWIVDYFDGVIEMYDKDESTFQDIGKYSIPLELDTEMGSNNEIYWEGSVEVKICIEGEKCRKKARRFKSNMDIKRSLEVKDSALRFARRVRRWMKGGSRYPSV